MTKRWCAGVGPCGNPRCEWARLGPAYLYASGDRPRDLRGLLICVRCFRHGHSA